MLITLLKGKLLMEMLDIFDENHNLIGTCSKKEVHEKGYWHQVFACLFINSRNNLVYLQYKNNSHNPLSSLNKLDISVSGHLISGETHKDGVREIKEEASLDVSYDQLHYLGMHKTNVTINKNYIIREFHYEHIYDHDFSNDKLQSIDDEVLYFVAFDLDKLLNFIKNPQGNILGQTPYGTQKFTKDDFITAYLDETKYYEKYLYLAKKIIKNEPVSWK